jgi:hypothetical protein
MEARKKAEAGSVREGDDGGEEGGEPVAAAGNRTREPDDGD